MQRLIQGRTFDIASGHLGVSVSDKDGVTVRGCDCFTKMPDESVRVLHDVLGAYLRRQKNKEKRNG
jgi:hypothetical protein